MKKHLSAFGSVVIFALLAVPVSASPLLDRIKGSDLVNAAKIVLDDSFNPESGEDKMLAIYTIGFIEGVIVSDIQKEATGDLPNGIFKLSDDGDIGVMKLIVEFVDGSPTLRAAAGAPLLHGLLCVRYGSTREIQTKGSRILIELSAIEGRKILDELAAARKKEENRVPGSD